MLDALIPDQMWTFVAVVDAGSFRAAAIRLGRVQSAVSHAIANLEDQLGVALFDRSGHRPALTAEGRPLLADTRAILLKVDGMQARARAALREGRCSLAIAAADTPDPRIELESLSIVSRAAVAAATHPLVHRAASRETLTVFDLADFIQIVVADPSPLTEGRDFGVLSPGTWCVSDNATKLALIL